MDAQRLVELIENADYAVAFTGAGVSTDAGIPDFRGPEGLYVTKQYDPEKVFEIDYFKSHPEYFYEFTKDYIKIAKNIQPTLTHHFLAWLEKEGYLKGVITQNIDALHHKAGSQNIIELHGTYWSGGCMDCSFHMEDIDLTWWEEAILNSPRAPVPICPGCASSLKPDVVFFGEPVRDIYKAQEMAVQSDLMLVLGSSLKVYPAAMLPQVVNGNVVVINKGDVNLGLSKNRYFINQDLNSFVGEMAEIMGYSSD